MLKISCSLADAPKKIKNLTYSHDYLTKASMLLENRLDNLSELGINVKKIDFEVSFGEHPWNIMMVLYLNGTKKTD